jgi:heptosyltransferase-2
MDRVSSRILVVRTDRIGDVVLSTPLIRAVRKTFPSSFIAAMVNPYARDVLTGNPHLNEIIIDDPEHEHAGRIGFFRQIAQIQSYRFDTALILLPRSRISWMLFLAGIRHRVSVETRLDHVLTFTRTVSRNKYIPLRHEADYCLDLGRKIGIHDDGLDVEVFLNEDERRDALTFLEQAGFQDGEKLIGLHPGSRSSSPNWRPENYAEVARHLLERKDVRIVVTGGAADVPLASEISSVDPRRVIDATGNPLRRTIGLISHMNCLVSASTGPMHLAAGLKVPTVSLFCPLPACSPTLWGPKGNKSIVILPGENYCQFRCPGDPHLCDFEGGIEPERVARAVGEFLWMRDV